MAVQNHARDAQNLLRSRLCNPSFVFKALSGSPDSNYSKLKFILSSSVTEACNNSLLLLGPRGSGKTAVLELVLNDLLEEYPDMISVIRLNGLLHNDDNCAFKEISRQLCVEHHLLFSKMASFDDNSQFLIAMLRECGLAHKTIVFVLEEFDLFAQGKQRLLYSLLDAMQSITSQAAVIGISCRLDADQLLEKRVAAAHLTIANGLNSSKRLCYSIQYKARAVSSIDVKSGYPSLDNFKTALSSFRRQPKQECIKDCSILELYILACIRRLESKEQKSYNFNSVMKEYKSIHDQFQTSDDYARNVCLRAFERLLQRDLICFSDNRGQGQSVEFRPVKCLISHFELQEGIKAYRSCPVSCFLHYGFCYSGISLLAGVS
ncbi:unnamed protein product [Linum tenue]|uniref:Origin of replication complex subunit 4 n=1 Tax=Linum tenue TaxID=586396 RepID=A0AAV0HDA4_9ROSI|nr:unnamed protein product [Linum tenue]